MSEVITLNIKLMGKFRFSSGDEWKTVDAITGTHPGKKQMAFLAFLLINHGRKISYNELIQRFWADNGKDPANALRNMIYKTRKLLKCMLPEQDGVLIAQSGGLVWDSERVEVKLDVEELEALYRNVRAANGDEELRVRSGLAASEIYGGEILPGVSMEWLNHLNIYYRNLYVDLCKTLVLALQERQQWDEVIRVCKKAYTVAPEIEEFTSCFMQALILMGQPELAIRHYEGYQQTLWHDFGVTPSGCVEQFYLLAVNHNESEDYEREFIEQITQSEESHQAFSCSLLVFRNMVNLEMRNMVRGQHQSSVAVLRLHGENNKRADLTDVRRMERVLLHSLRAGDPFARMSTDSFVLLLAGAACEDARGVVERARRMFEKNYPQSKATVQYHVHPLTVPQ